MNISIVIPHLGGYEMLNKCLDRIYASSLQPKEVIVVDNDCKDGSVKKMHKVFPDVTIISLDSNMGFSGAANAGVMHATSELLLLINNDCFLERETLKKLRNFLVENAQLAATQPVIYGKNGEIEHIGYWVDLVRAKAHAVNDQKKLPLFSNDISYEETFNYGKLYGLSATCLLIRKEVFMGIGMCDTTFHSYLEDIDLCFRMRKAGFSYYPCLKARCNHVHMATSSRMGSYKEKRDLLNWMRVIIKNYPRWFIAQHFVSLSVERMRNLNGLVKKMIRS